jgi:hypothetical protein
MEPTSRGGHGGPHLHDRCTLISTLLGRWRTQCPTEGGKIEMQSKHAARTTSGTAPIATRLIVVLVAIATLATVVAFSQPASAAQGSVEGLVQIREGGVTSPFPDVEVQVLDGSAIVATATSAPDGSYSIVVEEGSYTLRATPPDGSGLVATQQAITVGPDVVTRVDVLFEVVESRVALTGVVVGPDGQPVAGADVELRGIQFSDGATTSTDSTGTFVLQVLPRTYRFLEIDAGGADGRFPDSYRVRADDLEITDAVTFTVQLPTFDVTISTVDAVTGESVAAQIGASSRSDAGGPTILGRPSEVRATFLAVEVPSGEITVPLGPGTGTVSATAAGYESVFGRSFSVGTTDELTIEMNPLPEPTTFVGRVVDRNGLTISGATLIGRRGDLGTSDTDGMFRVEDTAVADDGVGRFGVVGAGATATLPSSWMMESTVVPHPAGTTIDLGDIVVPTRDVEFRIVDPDGVAVPKAFFVGNQFNNAFPSNAPVALGSFPGVGQSSYANDIVADDDGRLRMQLFDAAGYRLSFRAPFTDSCAYSDYVLQNITSSTFDVTDDSPIVVELGGSRCDAVEPLTAPVSGTLLVVGEPTNPSTSVTFSSSAQTSPSGGFLAQVTEGGWGMRVFFAGQPGVLPQLRLQSNGTVVTVADTNRIDLGTFDVPLSDLTVTVLTADGRPIEGVDVSTSNWSLSVPVQVNGFAFSGTSVFFGPATRSPGSPTTGADGTATLPLLAGGSYDIRFDPPPGYEPLVRRNVQLLPQGNALLVQLAYPHDPPVATITVDGTLASPGVFDDPVMVSVDATAAPGFAPESIVVTVDGGDPFLYSAPFEVTGGGEHTITAQVTDTGSVTGPPAIRTFDIVSTTDTTAPDTTAPDTTAPDTTAPVTTSVPPDTTAPDTTAPVTTAPVTTSVPPDTTAPDTTAPVTTSVPPDTTAPESAAPDTVAGAPPDTSTPVPTPDPALTPVGKLPGTGSAPPLALVGLFTILGLVLLVLSRRPSLSRTTTDS